LAAKRNDPDIGNALESSATHYWKKQVATEEMRSWGSGTVINSGDTYYEYIVEIKLYGQDFEFDNPIVTEQQYFKHVLTGTAGFRYDKKD
jgi:hypothetical protein